MQSPNINVGLSHEQVIQAQLDILAQIRQEHVSSIPNRKAKIMNERNWKVWEVVERKKSKQNMRKCTNNENITIYDNTTDYDTNGNNKNNKRENKNGYDRGIKQVTISLLGTKIEENVNAKKRKTWNSSEKKKDRKYMKKLSNNASAKNVDHNTDYDNTDTNCESTNVYGRENKGVWVTGQGTKVDEKNNEMEKYIQAHRGTLTGGGPKRHKGLPKTKMAG